MPGILIDAEEELQRVDDMVTAIINDEDLWADFVTNPIGTIQKNIKSNHLPEYPDIKPYDISNKLFHAVHSSIDFWGSAEKAITGAEIQTLKDEYAEKRRDGLEAGKVAHLVDYDSDFINQVIENPEFRSGVEALVNDLQRLSLVDGNFDTNDFFEAAKIARHDGTPLSELPSITGQSKMGPEMAATVVVAVVAVAVVAAEVAVGATVVGHSPEDKALLGVNDLGQFYGIISALRQQSDINKIDIPDLPNPSWANPTWSDPNNPDFPDIDPHGPFLRTQKVADYLEQQLQSDSDINAMKTLVRISTLFSDLHLSSRMYRENIEMEP